MFFKILFFATYMHGVIWADLTYREPNHFHQEEDRTPYHFEGGKDVGERYLKTVPHQGSENETVSSLPYMFTYLIQDPMGSIHYRKEMGDGSGQVAGIVGIRSRSGVHKLLNYMSNNEQNIEDSVLKLKFEDVVVSPLITIPEVKVSQKDNSDTGDDNEEGIENILQSLHDSLELLNALEEIHANFSTQYKTSENQDETTEISHRGFKRIPSGYSVEKNVENGEEEKPEATPGDYFIFENSVSSEEGDEDTNSAPSLANNGPDSPRRMFNNQPAIVIEEYRPKYAGADTVFEYETDTYGRIFFKNNGPEKAREFTVKNMPLVEDEKFPKLSVVAESNEETAAQESDTSKLPIPKMYVKKIMSPFLISFLSKMVQKE